MKKCLIGIILMLCTLWMAVGIDMPAMAADLEGGGLRRDVEALKKEVADLKAQIAMEKKEDSAVPEWISRINMGGGLSAGGFYASNPGKDTSDNRFLLSNFLVELSSAENDLPISFAGAFGETSAPSLLDPPDNNTDFDIEYASVTLGPFAGASLEVGLLQPNTGYEDTYTMKDPNPLCSVTGSQQPYNAYGARLDYVFSNVETYAGYFKTRLDDEEYKTNGKYADNSWEIGAVINFADNINLSAYNYRVNGLRNLTGLVFEYTVGNLYMAINADYWRWDKSMKDYYGRRSAKACAFYIEPSFGKFSCPVRLEFVNQGGSKIYSESTQAKRIYSASVTPTWHFSENTYFRVSSAYVNADGAFADHRGNIENSRVYLAAETGFLF